MNQPKVTIIGAGLAGCEAAWQLALRGVKVELFEMKPQKFSPAHKSNGLAELVCSNSLRSDRLESAVGVLKQELRLAKSLVMESADKNQVPAGKALAVDRRKFSDYITRAITNHPNIRLIREEVSRISKDQPVILATGPLTSDPLAHELREIIGQDFLHFYDAIAPIILAESIDTNIAFRASRYEKDEVGDYLNCPMDEDTYKQFVEELLNADKVPLKDFEDASYFEGCLPIEVMAQRGIDTLRFGPMKPVGLTLPGTDKTPYAVVQLRMEDKDGSLYNMVGFQTKLTYPEQKRIFTLIPGLEHAEFARLGSIHRNTFVCAPTVLNKDLSLKALPNVHLAGQISGVEGYVESTAMGWIAGIAMWLKINNNNFVPPPRTTAHGALINHITQAPSKSFQPMNVNFGLFERLGVKLPKRKRGSAYAQRALTDWEDFLTTLAQIKT